MSSKDPSVRVLLAVIAVLLGVNLLVQLNDAPRATAAGNAPPEPMNAPNYAQFQSMTDSLKDLNGKVEHLNNFLESGALSVKVKEMPEKTK